MSQAMLAQAASLCVPLKGSSGVLGADTKIFQQAAAARPCLPRQPTIVARKGRRQQIRKSARKEGAAAAVALATAATLVAPQTASALTLDDVKSALDTASVYYQQAADATITGYGVATNVFDQVVKAVQPAVEAATPVVVDATDKAIKAAAPVAADAIKVTQQALTDAGFDSSPASEYYKTAADLAGSAADTTFEAVKVVSPYASSALESALAADPLILAGGVAGLVVLYAAAPALVGGLAQVARGYKGDLTAPQALDLLSSSDYLLIDIRTDREKARSGIPSVPRNAARKLVPVPADEFEDRKLRGQLRNPRDVEAQVAALKISSLKKLSASSNVILLDAYADTAKQVARALTSLGFSNVYVVRGGFDGASGWLQSRLSTETFDLRTAEVLSPSRVISGGGSGIFGPRKTISAEILPRAPKRLSLPGN